MAQTIKLKRSAQSGASGIPSTSDLALGEVGINTYHGKMYIKKNDGTESIVEVGGLPLSGGTLTGNLSVGGSAYTTSADLNLLGDGLAIKNDKAGSSNNWSLIQNTDTGSASNLSFTTGLGVALTLNHNKSASFGANVNIPNGGLMVGSTTAPTGNFNSYISATRQITHNGNGGDLSVISDNNSSPVFYVKGTGNADLVNVFDNTTEVFKIADGGNATFSGTISSGAITSSGALTGTRLNITDTVAPYIVFTEGSNEVNMGVDNGVFWIRQNGLGGGDELKINAAENVGRGICRTD